MKRCGIEHRINSTEETISIYSGSIAEQFNRSIAVETMLTDVQSPKRSY